METTGVSTEFRYLLVRLGRQLHSHDSEGLIFVHKIQDDPGTKCDVGLHVLSSLEDMGWFDPLSPDKLQDILSKIGRKDLANDIKEYKQSAEFKKATKLESEREKDNKRKYKNVKRGKDCERGDAFDERCVAAKLLTGAEDSTNQEERRWRDLFTMALTHTAQLVEQTELLRKAIEEHDDSEQTNRSIEEALQAILTAQDEVESLSKTLKKAVAEACLRRASEENIPDSAEPEGPPAAEALNKKKGMHPSQSPKPRERANSYDGTGRSKVTKAAVLKTSSLSTSAAAPTPIGLTPTRFAGLTPIPAVVLTVPTQAPSSPTLVIAPVRTPNHTPFHSADTPTTNPTLPSSMPIPIPTYAKIAPATPPKPIRSSSLTSNPTPSTLTTVKHREGPARSPKPTTFSSTLNQAPNHTPTPNSTPSTIPAKLKAGPATSPKPKPGTKTPDFHRKLDSLLAGASLSTTEAHTAITHSNTFPSFNTIHSTTTTESTGTTSSLDFDEGHIYEDPNLCKEEESEGVYQNVQMVLSSIENAKGLTKRESAISIQVDSGLGAEDKSWGGELINMKGKPHYVNLPILKDEYAGLRGLPATSTPSTTQYTALNTASQNQRDIDWTI